MSGYFCKLLGAVATLALLVDCGLSGDDYVLRLTRAAYRPGLVTYRFPEGGVDVWDAGEQRWPDEPTLTCDATTRARLAQELTAGFGLMLDYRSDARFETDSANFAQNYRTPAQLGAVLDGALAASDGYGWLWSSNVDPWRRPGTELTPMPEAYLDVLRRARERASQSR